jgi:hypothetical protein
VAGARERGYVALKTIAAYRGGSKRLDHPPGHPVELFVPVVQARDQQVRELKPDVGAVPEIGERVEHRLKMPRAGLGVEALGESLEVNVCRVHMRVELCSRLGGHVADGDRHRLDPTSAAGVGDVDRVLHEDHRVAVRGGDARAAKLHGGVRDRFWRGGVGELVELT